MVESTTGARARPWLTGVLMMPVAMLFTGLFGGGLSFLLRNEGVGTARTGQITGLLATPHVLYFLWAPLTDLWMSRRRWLLVAAAVAAVLLVTGFAQPRLDSTAAVALLFACGCAALLVTAACGGMMGELSLERDRQIAASAYQIGSLVAGAAAVLLVTALAGRLSVPRLGWVLGVLLVAPAVAVVWARSSHKPERGFPVGVRAEILAEMRETFLRWETVPYLLAILLPMGSGAALGLLPGIARDYGVGAAYVAWLNGLGSAVLTAAGAAVMTLIPVAGRARVAFAATGLTNAATLAILWLGPLNPMTYVAGVVLYLFTLGACYAMFTAVVLEFMGRSGRSGSSRFGLINALGNAPFAYMLVVDGWGSRFGVRGVAGTECVLGGVTAAVLLVWFGLRRRPADS